MTRLLLRLFVPGYPDGDLHRLRGPVGTLAGLVGIFCNLLLFALKLIAGALSGSVSITADAMNNLSDASGSIVTLMGFRMADKPADEHHPYGHARAEYLSGLAVAVLILFIGAELGKSSLEKILSPTAVEFSAVTGLVLTASIAMKLWLALFNRRLGRLIDSAALMATSADSCNDCIATSAVLAASLLETFLNVRADGWMGLAVAVFILASGWSLARDTISTLLGENASPELRQQIADFVRDQEKVLGYHDLMVHDYGPGQRFASLHVEMDHREDPLECHEIIDHMERQCLKDLNVHLVIHYDPIVTDDPLTQQLKGQVSILLRDYDPRLSLHDFRTVPGRRHMNLVFDVALPSDLSREKEAILRRVEGALNHGAELQYHVKITFDLAEFN